MTLRHGLQTLLLTSLITISSPASLPECAELSEEASQTDKALCAYLGFLRAVDGLFTSADTREDKAAIVAHLLDTELVETYSPQTQSSFVLSDFQGEVCDHYYVCPTADGGNRLNVEKTTPLALAVSLGQKDLVARWLEPVDNINDLKHTSWGYRQPVHPMGQAIDPEHPVFNPHVPREDRLEIIDLLAAKGADFNAMLPESLYDNPAIAAGEPRGWGGGMRVGQDVLRVRALLYGADPTLKGTSYHPSIIRRDLRKNDFIAELHAQEKHLMQKVANHGALIVKRHPQVSYALGRAFQKEGDLYQAAKHMRAAAEAGLPEACAAYGAFVAEGEHVAPSYLTFALDMLPFHRAWRLSALRDEAIAWLERGRTTSSGTLEALYERNLEDGRATPMQLIRLGDYYKTQKNTAYTNYRWQAIGCYKAVITNASASKEEKARAHRHLARLYDTPYLAVISPTQFHMVRERDEAMVHYGEAFALGSVSAGRALSQLTHSWCLDPTSPQYNNITALRSDFQMLPASAVFPSASITNGTLLLGSN